MNTTFQTLFDPNKDYMYDLFQQYFGNPKLYKTKDVEQYSVYMAKVVALLGIEFKYLIVFVKRDNHLPGKPEFLSNLNWISLQTRLLKDEHDIQPFSYVPRRFAPLDKKIRLVNATPQKYDYSVDELPITITLLPNIKKGENFTGSDYSKEGSVIIALETYQTIVNVK